MTQREVLISAYVKPGIHTLRWFRLASGVVMVTDGSYWNPDDPDTLDWFVAFWIGGAG